GLGRELRLLAGSELVGRTLDEHVALADKEEDPPREHQAQRGDDDPVEDQRATCLHRRGVAASVVARASSKAATTRATCALVCASERNATSKAEGASQTPRASMAWCS